jgi:hypothetical protein
LPWGGRFQIPANQSHPPSKEKTPKEKVTSPEKLNILNLFDVALKSSEGRGTAGTGSAVTPGPDK